MCGDDQILWLFFSGGQLPPALPNWYGNMAQQVVQSTVDDDDDLSNTTSSSSGNSDVLYNKKNDGVTQMARGSTKSGLQQRKVR